MKLAAMKLVKHDGTDLEYMLTDQQGSTIAVLHDSGTLPFGDVPVGMSVEHIAITS